jgi:hypothetical protein
MVRPSLFEDRVVLGAVKAHAPVGRPYRPGLDRAYARRTLRAQAGMKERPTSANQGTDEMRSLPMM